MDQYQAQNQGVCESLLVRCKSKDEAAFESLYRLTSAKLYGVLYQLLRQEELAEDVMQEAYIKIWNSAPSYNKSKGKAITWMITIARNKGIDRLRSMRVRPESNEERMDNSDVLLSEDPDPTQLTHLGQDVHRLTECLKHLSEEQQQCILMSFYYGYTHQELSTKLDRPLGTVKAWVRRGLDKLRDCLL